MGRPSEPKPVKLFFAVLFSDDTKIKEAERILKNEFGEFDFISEVFQFRETDYYKDEMGDDIKRVFFSVQNLMPPDKIVYVKKRTAEIETSLSVEGKRKVNIDPGYIDFNKVVLATYKGGGCKVYIVEGVWIDIILRYEKGKFHSFPWTFPDFARGMYSDVLLNMRNSYKKQLNIYEKEIRRILKNSM